MEQHVCILDYGSGNTQSVYNLINHLGYRVEISNQPKTINECSHIVLPGVGSFGGAMIKIKENIPINLLCNVVLDENKPLLGICVGMQLLADKGNENGEHNGLGWITGIVEKLEIKNGNDNAEHGVFWKIWPSYVKFVCPVLILIIFTQTI